MFKWTPFPFIRFSLFLISGIVAFEKFPQAWEQQWDTLLVLLLIFACIRFLSYKLAFFKLAFITGLSAGLLAAYLGGMIANIRQDQNHPSHYSHYEGVKSFRGEVNSPPVNKKNYVRYDLNLKEVMTDQQSQVASGKIHLYIKKPISNPPRYGQTLLVKSDLMPIPPAMNPSAFDYRSYTARNLILSQSFVKSSDIKILKNNDAFSISGFSYRLREEIRKLLTGFFPQSSERQIAMALIVGVKDYLEPDLKTAYATAGATHVLAVSGLHVGILYLFIGLLLKPLKGQPKGRYAFAALTISVIWLYAMITGMSPSVFRAATMFSILAVSQVAGRKSNIYNSLGIAAFVLILVNPQYIFQVGFQLSFVAVFGIVYLFPGIYDRLHFSGWLEDKIWSITCVSIAAQISTTPLSLYYFHQFPTYFLISNLIVIPSAFVILLTGLPMIAIGALWSSAGGLMGLCLGVFIKGLNFLIQVIESFPLSKLDWIYLSPIEVFLVYGFLLAIGFSIQYKAFSGFLAAVFCVVAMLLSIAIGNIATLERKELLIYEVKGLSAVDFLTGGEGTLMVSSIPEDLSSLKFQLDPGRLAKGYRPVDYGILLMDSAFQCLNGVCVGKFGGVTIANIRQRSAIDSLPSADVLIISNNSVRNEELFQKTSFTHLIFDGTNARWYINDKRKWLMQRGIEAHFVALDGYWSLDLSKKCQACPSLLKY